MPAWRELEKEHMALERTRAMEEPIWRELSRMLEEDGGGDLGIRPDTTRQRPETYDSTPLYAKDDFVGGLFTEAMNPAERFFSYGLEDKDLEQYGPVKTWLWNFADITFGTLDPSTSSFYIEATPWLGDMSVFGGGFLGQEEDVGRTGRSTAFIDRTLPIRECYKGVDANGDTDRFHRAYFLNQQQAKKKFGDRAPQMSDGEQAKFVHAIYENPNYQPGTPGPRGMAWASCYASPDKPNFSVEKGYFEFPIHEIQWQRRSARPWATGPGHKALADMNMLDEMQRSMITAMQFEAEPMWAVHDEDIMSQADIQPSGILYGGMNSQGKRLAEPIPRGENLHLPMTAQEQLRQAIREGFHFSLMQIVNRPQMTLGEFMGWKEEKLRLLARHLVCIHRGLGGFMSRRSQILLRADAMRPDSEKRIPPPPPELAGQTIKINFVSPFAQVQKAAKARNAIQVGNAAMGLKELFPDIGDNISGDNLIRTVSDGLSGDPGLIVDPREVAQRRQVRAQQAQPDVELQRQAQKAAIVADVAHAGKAMSTTGGGGRPA